MNDAFAGTEIVRFSHVSKQYPGTLANDDVSLSIRRGEVFALVGENGAGKSTLMNLLYGLQAPTLGEIFIKGEKTGPQHNPESAMRMGVSMVHQHFKLVPGFTVAQNIMLGHEPKRGLFYDEAAAARTVRALSAEYGLQVEPGDVVRDLSVGIQQRVEILKALRTGADVLILDEPTAVLTPQEAEELFEVIRRVVDEKNMTVILITHKLPEVMRVSDRVGVMRRGRLEKVMETRDTSEREIASLMVGRDVIFGDLRDSRAAAGIHNCKYAASPSYDLYGNLYEYQLGMPVQKFRKYDGDYRMLNYRNIATSKREGMFVYGYLDYKDPQTGQVIHKKAPEQPYELYIRDAVGQFGSTPPGQWPSDKVSNMKKGDHNSGWHFVKYPMYPDGDPGQLQSDFAEIRLPEVIYSLAECMIRRGAVDDAAALLNDVRRRNYPEEKWPDVLYAPEGKVALDMNEMLDEWGREFFAEGRRRIDLIRFGKFSTGRWWDKTPDSDDHYQIFPLTYYLLNLDHKLKQNPGYNY